MPADNLPCGRFEACDPCLELELHEREVVCRAVGSVPVQAMRLDLFPEDLSDDELHQITLGSMVNDTENRITPDMQMIAVDAAVNIYR